MHWVSEDRSERFFLGKCLMGTDRVSFIAAAKSECNNHQTMHLVIVKGDLVIALSREYVSKLELSMKLA